MAEEPEASCSHGVDRIVVLESFVAPHAQTNPYSTQLFDSFPPSVAAEYFTWKRALIGNYDVFHVHWPEVKLRGASPFKSFLRSTLFLVTLLRIRVTRRALVRTLHDRQPHEPLSRLQQWIADLCDRWTTVWIVLNEHVPPPTDAPVILAPHGHYRDWFDADRSTPIRPGRLIHFGLIRRYKGVDSLLTAFRATPGPDLRLRIAGRPMDDSSAEAIAAAVASDERISARCEFIPDEELAVEILESELVVLPFVAVTNSGSLMLALSLGRPALVSKSPTVDALSAEVGSGWVHAYDGELDPGTIERTLEKVRSEPRSSEPDLSAREWPLVGELHADAFRLAMSVRRTR